RRSLERLQHGLAARRGSGALGPLDLDRLPALQREVGHCTRDRRAARERYGQEATGQGEPAGASAAQGGRPSTRGGRRAGGAGWSGGGGAGAASTTVEASKERRLGPAWRSPGRGALR